MEAKLFALQKLENEWNIPPRPSTVAHSEDELAVHRRVTDRIFDLLRSSNPYEGKFPLTLTVSLAVQCFRPVCGIFGNSFQN
jgi:hypothetical protein